MNTLEEFLNQRKLNPVEAMNLLQDNGIVSDLAVTAHDVAIVDCERAIAFLKVQMCMEFF